MRRVRSNQARLIHPKNARVRALITKIGGQTYAEFPRLAGQYSLEELEQWRELLAVIILRSSLPAGDIVAEGT